MSLADRVYNNNKPNRNKTETAEDRAYRLSRTYNNILQNIENVSDSKTFIQVRNEINSYAHEGIELIFIDNPTVSTPYIRKMLDIAKEQNIIAKITLENTVKLLLMVELDRVEQERLITIKRIKDGIQASEKTSGRKHGQLDKMTDELKADIQLFLKDRTIKQVDLMKKYNISRNTLKKYIDRVSNEQDNK